MAEGDPLTLRTSLMFCILLPSAGPPPPPLPPSPIPRTCSKEKDTPELTRRLSLPATEPGDFGSQAQARYSRSPATFPSSRYFYWPRLWCVVIFTQSVRLALGHFEGAIFTSLGCSHFLISCHHGAPVTGPRVGPSLGPRSAEKLSVLYPEESKLAQHRVELARSRPNPSQTELSMLALGRSPGPPPKTELNSHAPLRSPSPRQS